LNKTDKKELEKEKHNSHFKELKEQVIKKYKNKI
jgi:hypothetical protein